MVTLEWVFPQKRPLDLSQNNIDEDHFEGIKLVESLVREAIQNSMDEALLDNTNQPVIVKFHLGRVDNPYVNIAHELLNGLHQHVDNSNLDREVDADLALCNEAVKYLTIEDFYTKGLTGSVHQDEEDLPEAPTRNNWYYFVRAHKQSGKKEHEGGSWGVGKFIYGYSSKLRSLLLYTCRHDDEDEWFIGRSDLSPHSIGDTKFQPNGFLLADHGVSTELTQPLPTQDPDKIADLRDAFDLERDSAKSGLSIIIPFPKDELEFHGIVEHVIKNYSYPITSHKLEVHVKDESGESKKITSDTILDIVKSGEYDSLTDQSVSIGHVDEETILMMQHYYTAPKFTNASGPTDYKAPDWTDITFNDNDLLKMQKAYNSNEYVNVDIPIWIRRATPRQDTLEHFKVVIKQDQELERHRCTYVRDFLSVPGSGSAIRQKVRAFLHVDKGDLASILRFAEGPSHMAWAQSRARTNGGRQFTNPVNVIRFVNNAIDQILRKINPPLTGQHRDLFIDYLNLQTSGSNNAGGTGSDNSNATNGTGSTSEQILPNLDPTTRGFSITQVNNGFRIRRNHSEAINEDADFIVLCAYESHNATISTSLKNYSEHDFIVNTLNVQSSDVDISKIFNNGFNFSITGDTPTINVTGFDGLRDLVISLKENVESDDQPD